MSTIAVSCRSCSFRFPLALAGAIFFFDATKILLLPKTADRVCRHYRCARPRHGSFPPPAAFPLMSAEPNGITCYAVQGENVPGGAGAIAAPSRRVARV